MKAWSCETVRTGKWDLRVWRREDPKTYKHEVREPYELRAFCERNYDMPYEELAKSILEGYLSAERVEIFDWNRNGFIFER